MPSQLAILAAAAVATAGGATLGRPSPAAPGANACVNRRSIPHLHTPCSPNRRVNEQVAAATKNAQATVGSPHQLGTHPLMLIPNANPTDGWQGTHRSNSRSHRRGLTMPDAMSGR